MQKFQLMSGKKGATIVVYTISLMILFALMIIFLIIVFKVQVSIKMYTVRKDLFYIAQNSVIALDNEKLAYNEYKMDEIKMINSIKEIINRNYNGEVELLSAEYDYLKNVVKIKVNLNLKPIIKIGEYESIKIPIYEEVKLKLMEVK